MRKLGTGQKIKGFINKKQLKKQYFCWKKLCQVFTNRVKKSINNRCIGEAYKDVYI